MAKHTCEHLTRHSSKLSQRQFFTKTKDYDPDAFKAASITWIQSLTEHPETTCQAPASHFVEVSDYAEGNTSETWFVCAAHALELTSTHDDGVTCTPL